MRNAAHRAMGGSAAEAHFDEKLASAARAFPFRLAREAVDDLLVPDLRRYQIDLSVTAGLGWTCLAVMVRMTPFTAIGFAAWLASTWLLYRAALFVHELVHLRKGKDLRRFARLWDAIVGYPLLIPHFLYECHAMHHSKRAYGTDLDAEYLPYARMPRREIVQLVALSPLVSLFGPVRFGLIAPIAWLSPSVRRWSWRVASAIKLDTAYEGSPPRSHTQRREWLRQEAISTLTVWLVVGLVVANVLPWALLGAWYLVVTAIVTLNSIRLLGAHRYVGQDGEATLIRQMIDTVNVTRRPKLNAVWGPLGLRLHALHHLFPSLPYHNYVEAHQRLLQVLPKDSAYHLTEEPSLLAALRMLWRAPRPSDERKATP